MLINFDFILEVIFDLSIFFLFVIAFYKIFTQYVFPFLYEQVSSIKKHQIGIKNKIKLLDASQVRLESQIVCQKQRLDKLDDKVCLWCKVVKSNNKKLEQDRVYLIDAIKKKLEKQKEHLCLFKLEKNVIAQSIDQVYDVLSPIRNKARGLVLLSELVDKISDPYIKGK